MAEELQTDPALSSSMSSSSSPCAKAEPVSVTTKRPLRTYGKRKLQDRDADQPLKKRKTLDDRGTSPSNDTSGKTVAPALPDPIPASSSPKRSGILRYFRVASQPTTPTLPTSSTLASSSPQRAETVDLGFTPPSSPPASRTKRRDKRRLTTRLTSQSLSPDGKRLLSEKEATPCSVPEQIRRQVDDIEPADLDTAGNEEAAPREYPQPLGDVTNRRPASRQSKSVKSGTGKQMTLSLGKVGASSFVECEVCDTLYNTLHEADVKLHARRHAAVVRAAMDTGRRKTS